jgi:hypothetical protein
MSAAIAATFVIGLVLLMSIPQLVFGIQALIVGAHVIPCENSSVLQVWFLVFGSFALGQSAMAFLCNSVEKEGEEGMLESCVNKFKSLLQAFVFGWLCYGQYLIYHPPSGYPECGESDWNVFVLMANFMLWLHVVVDVLFLFLFCVGVCHVASSQK